MELDFNITGLEGVVVGVCAGRNTFVKQDERQNNISGCCGTKLQKEESAELESPAAVKMSVEAEKVCLQVVCLFHC